MSFIPIEFLHTDADAHLPPAGDRWAHVRRYRTRSFTFPLAVAERRLLIVNAHLAPLVTRVRRRVTAEIAIPVVLVATAIAFAVAQAPPAVGTAMRLLVLAATPVVAWLAMRAAMTHGLRSAGLAGGESIVVTHQRVLRFAPAPWRWSEAAPGAESPYDVVEVAHESIDQVRALHVLGFEQSGVLEILTYRGERLVFLHVPDVAAVAARIRTLAGAYAERRRPADVPLKAAAPQPRSLPLSGGRPEIMTQMAAW